METNLFRCFDHLLTSVLLLEI